jgi:hypothetical protein
MQGADVEQGSEVAAAPPILILIPSCPIEDQNFIAFVRIANIESHIAHVVRF